MAPGETTAFTVSADANHRVDGYFSVAGGGDAVGGGIDYAIRGLPLSTDATTAKGVKKLRSFTFFAPAKGDYAFGFKHGQSTPIPVSLNASVRTG